MDAHLETHRYPFHLKATGRAVVAEYYMRQILKTEEHVPIPPVMYSDPFYRITYLIKEEIRKHKWIEGEKGRALSWKEARREWCNAHQERYEDFIVDNLSYSIPTAPRELQAEPFSIGTLLSTLPNRIGG